MQELNERQQQFAVSYVANGGNGTKAAEEAGYSGLSARQQAHRMLTKPPIQVAIHAARQRALGDIGTLSVAQLRQMIESDSTPAGTRADLVKYAIGLAGHVAPKPEQANLSESETPLSDMPIEELEGTVQRLRLAYEREDNKTAH